MLPVAETIAAGAFASRALNGGEVMRIMTGAPLPEGADTVIRVEDTDGGIDRVTIRNARDVNKNIRPRGEDYRELSASAFQKESLRTTRCEEIEGRHRVVFYVDGIPG